MVVLVLVISTGYLIWSSLNEITEFALESFASKKLNADVVLDSVNLDFATAQATLENVNIGNPPGYTGDYAIKVERVAVLLDTASIGTGQFIINKIEVSNPDIVYEFSNSGTNIDQLIENFSANTSSTKDGNKPKSDAYFGIDNLLIHAGKVSVNHQLMQGKSLSFELPDIDIQELNNGNKEFDSESVAEDILVNIKTEIGIAIASASIQRGLEFGTNTMNNAAQVMTEKSMRVREKLDEASLR